MSTHGIAVYTALDGAQLDVGVDAFVEGDLKDVVSMVLFERTCATRL
jgi:hypothetical protein